MCQRPLGDFTVNPGVIAPDQEARSETMRDSHDVEFTQFSTPARHRRPVTDGKTSPVLSRMSSVSVSTWSARRDNETRCPRPIYALCRNWPSGGLEVDFVRAFAEWSGLRCGRADSPPRTISGSDHDRALGPRWRITSSARATLRRASCSPRPSVSFARRAARLAATRFRSARPAARLVAARLRPARRAAAVPSRTARDNPSKAAVNCRSSSVI